MASEILTEAACWLIERGEPLWQPEDLRAELLRPLVETGSLHLVRYYEAVGFERHSSGKLADGYPFLRY